MQKYRNIFVMCGKCGKRIRIKIRRNLEFYREDRIYTIVHAHGELGEDAHALIVEIDANLNVRNTRAADEFFMSFATDSVTGILVICRRCGKRIGVNISNNPNFLGSNRIYTIVHVHGELGEDAHALIVEIDANLNVRNSRTADEFFMSFTDDIMLE